MKKEFIINVKVMFISIALVIFTGLIEYFPWWSFIVPVLFLGIIKLRNSRTPAFGIGFLSGFIVWFGANLYFDIASNGLIAHKISNLLSLPKIIVFLISGVIGGLLTGLALYTGKSVFRVNKNIRYKNDDIHFDKVVS